MLSRAATVVADLLCDKVSGLDDEAFALERLFSIL
jgi:hypothetical protein